MPSLSLYNLAGLLQGLENIAYQSTEVLYHYAGKCSAAAVQSTLLDISGQIVTSAHSLVAEARRYRQLTKEQDLLISVLDKVPSTSSQAIN